MEKVAGVVTDLDARMEISGGGQDSSTITTTHVLLFRISGRQVRLSAFVAPAIRAGDLVQVAGAMSGGVLEAYAYKNDTTGAHGDSGLGLYSFTSIAAFGGTALSYSFLRQTSTLTLSVSGGGFDPLNLLPMAFAAVACFFLYKAWTVLEAKLQLHGNE